RRAHHGEGPRSPPGGGWRAHPLRRPGGGSPGAGVAERFPVIALLIGAAVGLVVSWVATPPAIAFFRRRSIGQFIQEEVEGHLHKQGTPTMGGVVFVGALVIAYLVAHLRVWTP